MGIVIALGAVHHRVGLGLPLLDGNIETKDLAQPVTIERDEAGVPLIRAANRLDAAYGLGFAHAQERFFQMDLARRAAAGELAELFGEPILKIDRRFRIHQFRERAKQIAAGLTEQDRRLLHIYAQGVNRGLGSLKQAPFEYALLGVSPQQWRDEDTLLVVFYMYLLLQDSEGDQDYHTALLYDSLPKKVADFLAPIGNPDWDSPMAGATLAEPPLPTAQDIDLRDKSHAMLSWPIDTGPRFRGSNAWAVGGAKTAHGGALLANDMHLTFGMPNTFYQATLIFASGEKTFRVAGVTLPGFPFVVAGSNGEIAWGLSNSAGAWSELIRLDGKGVPEGSYRTRSGTERIETREEILHVARGADDHLTIKQTRWGPVIRTGDDGSEYAELWVAHFPQATALGLGEIETAGSADTALAVAPRLGIPAQNLVVADRDGHVGWTIGGPIPHRVERNGRTPLDSSMLDLGWNGWLGDEGYPKITDPVSGLIWTANARVVGGEDLSNIGYGYYILGARAKQIHDALASRGQFDENAMLQLQRDDRALFLARWRQVLIDLLSPERLDGHPARAELRRQVEDWGGRASASSVGYRLVRDFRLKVEQRVFAPFIAEVTAKHPGFAFDRVGDQREGPLWRMVTEQPANLLDGRYSDWTALLLAAVDDTIAMTSKTGSDLKSHPWGEENRLAMHHPMSPFFPLIGHWLDMPEVGLDGDDNMPLAQISNRGPVMRLVVEPGHEDQGMLEMPGGQGGNPRSPYYGARQSEWLDGKASPLLAQTASYRLTLKPEEQGKELP